MMSSPKQSAIYILQAEVEDDHLNWLSGMPSMVTDGTTATSIRPGTLQNKLVYGCYILPPIKYPDGKNKPLYTDYIFPGHFRQGCLQMNFSSPKNGEAVHKNTHRVQTEKC